MINYIIKLAVPQQVIIPKECCVINLKIRSLKQATKCINK